MLNANMNIFCLMFYARRVEEARAKWKSRDDKRARSFMELPQRIGLGYKTSLNFGSEFQIKYLPNSQVLVVIGCLTIYSRGEKVLKTKWEANLEECVVKSTTVIALRVRIIALVVARVVTRWEIVQTWIVKTVLVAMIMQVVLVILQRRTAFMLSSLGWARDLSWCGDFS